MQSREFQASSIPFAPVLYPSEAEFEDFNAYIEKVEKEYSSLHGMVKIVPPNSWKAREANYENTLDHKIIQGPIEQNPYGKGGVYECVHIMKKSIPFKEYRKKAKDFDKISEGQTIERVEELFWKNISFSPPLYGSDMEMSLFDEGVKWSLNDLSSVLSDGLSAKISGVNTPYLYIGSWKTLFAWHKEDLDLGAINYLHYGKPKFWYCISRDDSWKLEQFAKQNFSENFAKCTEFLRHKTTVINPYNLTKKYKGDIQISKIAQQPGEFIVVFSGAYHHGFNWGYNIAEAVNYATLTWLDYFPASNSCRCTSDTVNIDHNEFIANLLKKKPELQSREEVQNFLNWLDRKQILADSLIPYHNQSKQQIEQTQSTEIQLTNQIVLDERPLTTAAAVSTEMTGDTNRNSPIEDQDLIEKSISIEQIPIELEEVIVEDEASSLLQHDLLDVDQQYCASTEIDRSSEQQLAEPSPKKRGRKPKSAEKQTVQKLKKTVRKVAGKLVGSADSAQQSGNIQIKINSAVKKIFRKKASPEEVLPQP